MKRREHMARRSLLGQLSMFDLLHTADGAAGEVEMVSLMADYEDDDITPIEETTQEELAVEENVVKDTEVEDTEVEDTEVENTEVKDVVQEDAPVMHRTWTTKAGTCEIAYLNYNKVRFIQPGQEPQIKEFASSKEAVDYYIAQIQGIEEQ